MIGNEPRGGDHETWEDGSAEGARARPRARPLRLRGERSGLFTADRLLGVDLSYRHTAAMHAIRDEVRAGALGEVFAADLTFHNAYGPQSGWFWDPALSGGGCLIDLGIHLVDLALWTFDFPEAVDARVTLLRGGRPVVPGEVEDFATAEIKLANGPNVRLA